MNRIQNAHALTPKHGPVSEKKKSADQWPIHVKYTSLVKWRQIRHVNWKMEKKHLFTFKTRDKLSKERSKPTLFKAFFSYYMRVGREPLKWDGIMKMGEIERGFNALLHASVLVDQTEGISNKYRMPQKCTLPRRGWGGPRPGSTHLNTIFIMLWPHKVISLEFDDWHGFAARYNFPSEEWLALMDASLLLFFSFYHSQTPNFIVSSNACLKVFSFRPSFGYSVPKVRL